MEHRSISIDAQGRGNKPAEIITDKKFQQLTLDIDHAEAEYLHEIIPPLEAGVPYVFEYYFKKQGIFYFRTPKFLVESGAKKRCFKLKVEGIAADHLQRKSYSLNFQLIIN